MKRNGNDGYGAGWAEAYGATSWTLSGMEFDVVEEAADRAERAFRRNGWYEDERQIDWDWMTDYLRGFMAYCLRHSGTWTAKVGGWQGEGLYTIGYSDGGMDWTSDGPVWLETAEDLADELALAWLWRFGPSEAHLPVAEYLGEGEEE